jgi:hypothetical protein
MSEEMAVIPGYKRIGICKECGARVYAPEPAGAGGEFKRMSACACAGGPKTVLTETSRLASSPLDKRVSEEVTKAA